MTTRTIHIVTRVNDGIHPSQGGGSAQVQQEWTIGPRNLLAAFDALPDCRAAMNRAYGPAGHATWMEIDGRRITSIEEGEYAMENETRDEAMRDYRRHSGSRPLSRTEWARRFITALGEE